jgi:hypothetical protein
VVTHWKKETENEMPETGGRPYSFNVKTVKRTPSSGVTPQMMRHNKRAIGTHLVLILLFILM